MSFVSFDFILFLTITVVLYFIIPKKFRFIVLLLANTYFYFISCGFNILYLIISIISIYIAGILMTKYKNKKKLIFLIALLLNLGILFFFKDLNPFIGTINKLFKTNIVINKFIAPIGISYYTLVALSYIIDIYLGKAKSINNFFKIYLTMTFFPLMIEGPIVKVDEVADSLYEGQKFDYNNLKYGYLRILWGFAKKLIIADRVGVVVDKIFAGGFAGTTVLLGMILYVIQIYTEFSGCMDIVIGIGRIFNINIPENFKEPFFSKDVSEFWRRWHITLGRWLKDYIFYPVMMCKKNMKINLKAHKKLPRFLADVVASFFPLLCVWVLMGLWHGYGKKYLLYGMYYFSIILVGMLLKPVFNFIIKHLHLKTNCFSYHLFQSIRTFIFVTIGMTLFRADTIKGAILLIQSIFKTSIGSIVELIGGAPNLILIIISLLFIVIIDSLKYCGHKIDEDLEKQNITFRYLIFVALFIIIIIFGMYGEGYNPSSFIYGGF